MKDEKQLYALLNDVQTDLSGYEDTLNDLEKKRMQYSAKQIVQTYPKVQKGQHKNRTWIAAACTALLVCGFMMTDAGSHAVYAAGESVAYHISSFLGIDRNLSDYATVIGTEQTDNGYTIRLNEVILDQNTLIVATDVSKTDGEGILKEEVFMGIPVGDVYINGRSVVSAASGSAVYDEEEHFIGALFEYHLQDTIDTTSELDIKLVFHNINVQKEKIAGSWEFHFIADGAALAKDTVRIPLNIVVETENGAKVVFQYFSENLLSERIYYGVEGNLNKSVYLIGEDDLGNKVKFLSNVYESNLDGTKGQGFMTPYSMNMITDKTKSLTLTPYVSSDIIKDNRHFRGELVQAGEPFVIELK